MDTIGIFNQRSNDDDELEIIIPASSKTCQFLTKGLGDFMVHKHIDYWSGNNRLRHELGGKKEYIKKELIGSEELLIGNAKIMLKQETSIEPSQFNMNTINLIRLKYTQSYKINIGGHWVLDISRISKHKVLENIIDYKEYLLKANSFDDINLRPFHEYSIELECLDKKTTFENMIDSLQYVVSMIDKRLIGYKALEYLGSIFYGCTGRKPSLNIKSLLNQVINVEATTYKALYDHLNEYYVCEKTDGYRYCVIVLNGYLYLLSDGSSFIGECKTDKNIILDCELCDDVFWVFDCLQNDKVLCDEDTKVRLEEASKTIDYVQELFNSCKFKYKIKMKNMQIASKETIREVYHKKYKCPIDGLIFTKSDTSYFTKVYKWKPLENLTIDFLVIKAERPIKSFVKRGHTMFFLYVTIKKRDYDNLNIFSNAKNNLPNVYIRNPNTFPVRFSIDRNKELYIFNTNDKKTIDSLSSPCIGEFKQIIKNGTLSGWELVKVREDRQHLLEDGEYFGNSYYVAERTMEQYYNPLMFEDLIDYKGGKYFLAQKDKIYKAFTSVSSLIKNDIYKNYGSGNLIEPGCGKGQDLGRMKAYFNEVLAIDVDSIALEELLSRMSTTKGDINLKILNADFMGFAPKDIEQYKGWANMLSVNFAIHYMITKLSDITKFRNIVSYLLNDTGYCSFTCLNGKKVMKALEHKDRLDYFEDGVLKYSLISVKRDKEITLNQIKVLLPFSNGSYYTENLVDVNKIISVFTKKNYKLIESKGFDKYLFNPKLKLSDVDKEYGKFNHYVVMVKET